MANNESTNITGNIAGEKLTQQKKEVSIVQDADGTVRLCTSADTNASVSSVVAQKKQFIMQRVTDGYIWGGITQQYLLMENPSPSTLDNNDALDSIESNHISNTSSQRVLNVVFCSTDEAKKQIYGITRIISSVGVKRISGDGLVHVSMVVMGIGYIDSFGVHHEVGVQLINDPYATTSVEYVERTIQLFVRILTGFNTDGNRLAVHVEIHASVDAGTVGQVCLNLRRGLADSYMELVMR